MEKIQRDQLYEEIAARGLISELHDRAKKRLRRDAMSRNTVHLAFSYGPTTPLRKKILEEAETLLKDIEAAEQVPMRA